MIFQLSFGQDPPTGFEFNQTTEQGFYFFFNINIQEEQLDENDWIGSFKKYDESHNGECTNEEINFDETLEGMCIAINQCTPGFLGCESEDCPPTLDVDNNGVLSPCACPDLNEDGLLASQNLNLCLGARRYGDCINLNTRNCDIPVMGYDGYCYSGGYISTGEIPYFKIYDNSENEIYYATPSENVPWHPFIFETLDYLTVHYDCNENLGGNAIIDECGICCGGNTSVDCSYYVDINDFSGAYDFNNEGGGEAFIDGCGICSGGLTGIEPCQNDCFGLLGGDNIWDDCGICSGGNSNHEANSDKDCNDDCFGDAFVDDCNVCSDGNTGHESNSDKDCNGDCFGDALIDNCDECTGGNTGLEANASCSGCTDPLANNYNEGCYDVESDEAINCSIDNGSCVYDSGPVAFQFNQSTVQAFYFIESLSIDNNTLDSEDWLGAFKDLDGDGIGDVCVGARKWETSLCNNGVCDIGLMGWDQYNPDNTENYMEEGDAPVFVIYDQSENIFYDAQVLNSDGYDFSATDFTWSLNIIHVIPELNVFYDCNQDLGGHAFIDYCDDCVAGNTEFDEGYADLGCGCDELAPAVYCEDTDNDGLGNPETENTYCLNDIDWWEGNPVQDCSDNLPDCACDDNNFEDCYDCQGSCNGDYQIDECGICTHPDNPSECDCPLGQEPDCNLVCYDSDIIDEEGAFYDDCGICSAGNTGLTPNAEKDCHGDCFGTAIIDDCDVCSAGNTDLDPNADKDCYGICYGEAFLDDCDVCSEGLSGHEENSDKDCSGDCNGDAVIDDCGLCSEGNSGHEFNSDLDDCGVCGDVGYYDHCGVCDSDTDSAMIRPHAIEFLFRLPTPLSENGTMIQQKRQIFKNVRFFNIEIQ